MIVETEKNFITSENNNKPSYACNGQCKKVWWPDDINDQNKKGPYLLNCNDCNGKLSKAIEGVHYKVIGKNSNDQESRYKIRYVSMTK